MTIRIEDIEIEVERKLIRSIRLTVKPPDGRVHLNIPFYLTQREAEAFLLSRWEWICRNRTKILSAPPAKQPEYVSGEEHLLKPSAAIFQRLTERFGLTPSECIFIDDNAANVEGSIAFGIPAIRFQSAESLRAELRSRGVLPL
jgi:predicted metal-dependent hydrolase